MLLDGKTGVVFGVANKRSLAWAIARRAAEEGARRRIFTRMEKQTSAGLKLVAIWSAVALVFIGFNLAFLPMHWTGLAGMPLTSKSRLSVQPVTDREWQIIRRMGGEKE